MKRIKAAANKALDWFLLFVVAFLFFALGGCAQFDNRVACTVDGKRAFFVSEYSRVGVASEIAEVDARVICEARERRVYLVGPNTVGGV